MNALMIVLSSMIMLSHGQSSNFIRHEQYEYFLGGTVPNISVAEDNCEKLKAGLAIVKHKSLASFLYTTIINHKTRLYPYSFYIGLKTVQQNKRSEFVWLDNSRLIDTYSHWDPSDTNTTATNQSCVTIGIAPMYDVNMFWKVYPCNTESRYICSRIPDILFTRPSGIFYRRDAYEYHFGRQVANYGEALKQCRNIGGVFAFVKDSATEDFLKFEIKQNRQLDVANSYYIGLLRINSARYVDSSFQWIDGTAVTDGVGFVNWHLNEPNFYSDWEFCVTLSLLTKSDRIGWNDIRCSDKSRYICQRPFVESTTSQVFIPFGDFEYHFGHPVKNYTVAQRECRSRSARLAVIKSEDIRQFLKNETDNITMEGFPYSFFIGMKRVNNHGNGSAAFQWIDGSTVEEDDWASGEPDNKNGKEKCVIMGDTWVLDPSMTWKDASCETFARFICQRIPDTTLYGEFGFSFVTGDVLAAIGVSLFLLFCIGMIVALRKYLVSLRLNLKEYEDISEKLDKDVTDKLACASVYFDTHFSKTAYAS